jgi:hypothetical protein
MNDKELDQLLDIWQTPEPPPTLRTNLRANFTVKPRRILGMHLRWLVLPAAATAALAVGNVVVRTPEIHESARVYQVASGVYASQQTLVDPPASLFRQFSLGCGAGTGRSMPSGEVMHANYCYDSSSYTYSGYELAVESLGAGQYTLAVEPLSVPLLKLRHASQLSMRAVPLRAAPGRRVVREGEPFEIELMVTVSGERIYDRIRLSSTPFPEPKALGPELSNPLIRALKAMSLRVVRPTLLVNGKFVAQDKRSGGSGPTVWFYLPGKGRYLIALDPQFNSRFVKVGRVDGNVVEFRLGDDEFRIESEAPIIISGGGERSVFVFHQQDFVINSASPLARRPILFGPAGPPFIFR